MHTYQKAREESFCPFMAKLIMKTVTQMFSQFKHKKKDITWKYPGGTTKRSSEGTKQMQNLSWKTTAALITTKLPFVVEKIEQLFPSLECFQTYCAWHPEVSVIFEQIKARYMKRQIPPSCFFFFPW